MEQMHRCPECGYPLSDKWDAIWHMKELLAKKNKSKVHIDKKIINPSEDENLLPIYKFLKIDRYCCRTHILTQINMRDVVT